MKKIGLVLLVMMMGCAPEATSVVTPSATATATATATSMPTVIPTNTIDPVIAAKQAALLYSQDFEGGNADGTNHYGPPDMWHIVEEGDSNHIYCNDDSSIGVIELIGTDLWSNYALELRVKAVQVIDGSYFSVYSRFNRSNGQQYYGSLDYSRKFAGLAVSEPFDSFGNKPHPATLDKWYTMRLEVAGQRISFYIDDQNIATGTDGTFSMGKAGFSLSPHLMVCVDDIRVWALDEYGKIATKEPGTTSSAVPLAKRLGSHQFPKLFNQNQDWDPKPEVLTQAYYWDLLTFPMEVAKSEMAYLGPNGWIRSQNPNTVILATISIQDYSPEDKSTTGEPFVAGLQPNWTMKTITGEPFYRFYYGDGVWTPLINLSTDVATYIPNYINDNIMAGGLFDGVFYDGVNEDNGWLATCKCGMPNAAIDINLDGNGDTADEVNSGMDSGMITLLNETRSIFPADTIITGNAGGGSLLLNAGDTQDTILAGLLNGRMMEGFLTSDISSRDWLTNMRNYYLMQEASLEPKTPMLMAYCNGSDDYQTLRYTLASALMFNGYFTCTNNQPNDMQAYTATWWFDEYSVNLSTGQSEKSLAAKGYLGMPVSDAEDADDNSIKLGTIVMNNNRIAAQMAWRRDFQNGIVLVNPSEMTLVIDLKGTYRRIKGELDPKFNDGAEVTAVTLGPKSGIILLRMP